MWLILSFASAVLLGLYDVAKKSALTGNAVLPVLFFNTLLSSLIFAPLMILSAGGALHDGSLIFVPPGSVHEHLLIVLKSAIVLCSWIFSYFGIKHLPLTIAGPIMATRPVMVLLGAMLVFGERLNMMQWAGVLLSFLSLFLLSMAGRREGIDFKNNKWIFFVFMAALMGAVSALYDKFLMRQMAPMFVQSWFNIYQFALMTPILFLLWFPGRNRTTPFRWRWSIALIALFVSAADFVYFYALSFEESMISVVSMIRRSSVVVSFFFGAWMFREKNIKSKALDLLLILVGMLFLYFGSR